MTRYAFLMLSMSLPEAKAILGFPPDASPSEEEVMQAWREMAFKNHPDRGGDPEKMVEINVAKDLLQGKGRPTYDFSSPTSEPGTPREQPWTKPKDEKVTFDEAKSKAGVPSGVEWKFITDTQRGTGYSSDEFHRSDNAWVAYGTTDSKHVFVGMRRYVKEEYFIGGQGGKDIWTMKVLDFPKKGEEGTEPAWLFGNVVRALKAIGSESRFNAKVVDATGWKFDDKRPTGATTSIKHWLANSGQVADDDPRVQNRKQVVEVKYLREYQEKPHCYKIIHGKPPFEYSNDYEGIEIIINGKPYWLDEADVKKVVRGTFLRIVFGDYVHSGNKKNLTRSKNGKKLLKLLAEEMKSLPPEAKKNLEAASDQMK